MVDICIVGAGVVGCAIARELAPRYSVAVLERREGPGLETSRWNSGVLHTGLHLRHDFLKAEFARTGSALALAYCTTRNVPVRRVGMHIVVAAQDLPGLMGETQNLCTALVRAREQDIPVQFASGWSIHRREPQVTCLFGLSIPHVHIVDAPRFVSALEVDARELGAEFRYLSEVVGVSTEHTLPTVETTTGSITARVVVNAAGLGADTVARYAGYPYRQIYYRGEYYAVDPASGITVTSLVYPVYRPGDPGLGIHLTPRMDGTLLLGPNAKRVASPEERSVVTPPEEFHAAVSRFLPALRVEHLIPAFAGIRPKLAAERKENDFLVRFETDLPMVNLIGIESPGLTAAMALAQYVHQAVDQRLQP